jgi:hypothetical protein
MHSHTCCPCIMCDCIIHNWIFYRLMLYTSWIDWNTQWPPMTFPKSKIDQKEYHWHFLKVLPMQNKMSIHESVFIPRHQLWYPIPPRSTSCTSTMAYQALSILLAAYWSISFHFPSHPPTTLSWHDFSPLTPSKTTCLPSNIHIHSCIFPHLFIYMPTNHSNLSTFIPPNI